MNEKRRLGRGLEALLGIPQSSQSPQASQSPDTQPGQPTSSSAQPQPSGEAAGVPPGQRKINVYDIDTNPYQPRYDFDPEALTELVESIQQHGLMQPVVVREVGGRFQLIAGERRWRAAVRAGWTEVPAIVREADDRQVAELTIVENLQRRDLGPLEKAASFQKYIDSFGATHEELAARLSVDRSTVTNLIRLLELPESVREAILQGKITAGHARALLPLGEEREQVAFCQRIQTEHLSVRAVEQLVLEAIQAADGEPLGGAAEPKVLSRRDSHLAALEQQFRAALGTKVEIHQSARGRGRITIRFNSAQEFERLKTLLCEREPKEQSRAG